jgi:hypothetical protein
MQVPYNAGYHVLVPHGDVAQWAIVIGYGQHTHMRPTLLPSILQTRKVINAAVAADCDAVGRVTTRDVMIRIERATGLNAPAGMVSRMLREQRRVAEPHGSSIAALDALATSTHDTYVQDVCGFVNPSDPNDFDDVGVSIMFANIELLAAAAKTSRFGVDGSRGVVDSGVEHKLDFEMVTIVSRTLDHLVGQLQPCGNRQRARFLALEGF